MCTCVGWVHDAKKIRFVAGTNDKQYSTLIRVTLFPCQIYR